MRQYIDKLIILTLLVFLGSCSKFIDRNPISESTIDKIESKADLEALVIGAYKTYTWDYFQIDRLYLGDLRSGNTYAGGDNSSYFEMAELRIQIENEKIRGAWTDPYKLISCANLILEKVDVVSDPLLTTTDRDRIKGEALFLRGQAYYELAKNFGGVPIITNTATSGDPFDNYVPRSTEAETYLQAETDLNNAVLLLPDNYGTSTEDKAKATKGAAYAYLAKVYAQQPTKDWNKVIICCDAVINSPAGYSLMSTYPPLFDGNNYNNVESILEPQFVSPDFSWIGNMFLGNDWRRFNTPSKDIISAFNTASPLLDARYNSSVKFDIPNWGDEYWNNGGLAAGDGLIPFFYKLKNVNSGNTTDRIPFVRLADIKLLKAEALVMTGDLGGALTIVLEVRSRSITGATTSVTSIEDVLKERRLELFGEGQFWYDLVRHGLAGSHRDTLTYRNQITGVNTIYPVEPRDLLLPIPLQEIERNPTLVQNPGY